MKHTSTEQTQVQRDLASEYRPTMPSEVLHLWAKDAQAELRRLHARVQELEAAQAQRAQLTEAIPPSPTLWAFLTKGMTLSAIEQLPNDHDKKVYLDRAAKNWAAIRSECITQEKQGCGYTK
jgi:hypothetical protein